jgi:hypothetical protein
MSREVFFVIAVDLDEKIIRIDDEVFTARFDLDEAVWDTEKTLWREAEDEEYELALELLNTKRLENE